jgi:hypothetical protein
MISTYVTFIIIEGLNFIDFDSGIAGNGARSVLNSVEAPVLQEFEVSGQSTSCSEGGLESEHPSANVEASRNSARVRPYEVSGQKSPFFDHEATQNYSFGTIIFARQNLKI